MIPAGLMMQIAGNSLVTTGTRADWASLLQKKTLSIGFLGGSVTQGYFEQQIIDAAYPELTAELLRQEGYAVNMKVCAEAGMDTMIGNVLSDSVILPEKPDLIVLEFGINETTLQHSMISFESLLRRFLEMPEPPVVCILITRSANDYSCECYMLPMAEHYGMPCISIRKGLNPLIDSGHLCWNDFADAEGHPHAEGHRLLAECLMYLIHTARQAKPCVPAPLPEPWIDAPFTALRLLTPEHSSEAVTTDAPAVPRNEWYFRQAWQISAASGPWTISTVCRSIILIYETDKQLEYGDCRVTLDGEPVRHPIMNGALLSGYSLYGWGNPRSIVLLHQADAAAHTLTLSPENGSFYLLGCAVQ